MLLALLLAGLASPLFAQQAEPADSAPPPVTTPTDTVGPAQLRDFSLGGPQTRPITTQPRAADILSNSPPPRTEPVRVEPPATASATRPQAPAAGSPPTDDGQAAAPATARPAPRAVASSEGEQASGSSVTIQLPPVMSPERRPTLAAPPVDDTGLSDTDSGLSAASSALGGAGSVIPWLVALAMAIGAGIWWLLRQRSNEEDGQLAFAGGPTEVVDRPRPIPPRAAPSPAPAPVPPSAPRPPAPSPGIVASSLRPWMEIDFQPIRVVIEEDSASVQFDVTLLNSGAAPARDVLVEACLVNAGPIQDQQIQEFFTQPKASGDRIVAIPPLERVSVRSAVTMPASSIRALEVEGRRLFLPMVAFNVLYRWGGSEAQSSASWLVGRGGDEDEKLAPIRLDLGPRLWRNLSARRYTLGVRR